MASSNQPNPFLADEPMVIQEIGNNYDNPIIIDDHEMISNDPEFPIIIDDEDVLMTDESKEDDDILEIRGPYPPCKRPFSPNTPSRTGSTHARRNQLITPPRNRQNNKIFKNSTHTR